jgi:hypothetical protein
MDDFSSYNNPSIEGMQPVAIVSQLLQKVVNIHHIDELLTWIANIVRQRLGIDAVQIWAAQARTTGALSIKLRASVSQHFSQTRGVTESAEVAALIEHMLREKRGVQSIPVTKFFSQYQATMLMQQNYHFLTAYFVTRDVLLPPTQRGAQEGEIDTPFQMVFSFFTQQPLQASQTRAIRFLVEQSLRIAISHELLSTQPQQPSGSRSGTLTSSARDMQAAFAHLIPAKAETEEIEQAENPFNNAVIIPEKKTREIYSLIDGKKDIAQLALLTRMTQKEVLEALQSLIAQGHISYTR